MYKRQDLQRVRLDAYREIVVNDTTLPHTFDGDGGLTRHFGQPAGVCYLVVGDAVTEMCIRERLYHTFH